jgi:hypothetical protein
VIRSVYSGSLNGNTLVRCSSVRCGPCFSGSEGEHCSRVAQSRKTGVETVSAFTDGTKENTVHEYDLFAAFALQKHWVIVYNIGFKPYKILGISVDIDKSIPPYHYGLL